MRWPHPTAAALRFDNWKKKIANAMFGKYVCFIEDGFAATGSGGERGAAIAPGADVLHRQGQHELNWWCDGACYPPPDHPQALMFSGAAN